MPNLTCNKSALKSIRNSNCSTRMRLIQQKVPLRYHSFYVGPLVVWCTPLQVRLNDVQSEHRYDATVITRVIFAIVFAYTHRRPLQEPFSTKSVTWRKSGIRGSDTGTSRGSAPPRSEAALCLAEPRFKLHAENTPGHPLHDRLARDQWQ
jgi:hypothetical protein